MNVSYWISRRLRLGGKGSSAGVVIAVAGVALAVMVMEFTLAIVVGFKDQIRAKLAGFDAQISVYGAYDPYTGSRQPYVSATPQLEKVLADALPDTERRLAVRQPGIIKTDNDFEGIMFIGRLRAAILTSRSRISSLARGPDYASDSCRNSIVISEATASALGLDVGDKVYSPIHNRRQRENEAQHRGGTVPKQFRRIRPHRGLCVARRAAKRVRHRQHLVIPHRHPQPRPQKNIGSGSSPSASPCRCRRHRRA